MFLVVALFLLIVVASAGAQPSLQRPQVEKRLEELDRMRAEARGFRMIADEVRRLTFEIIRLNPHGSGEAKTQHRESEIIWCEKEPTWRKEFAALELSLKKSHNSNLPSWVRYDRSWQKLDLAMKEDSVKVAPSECRPLYERTLRKEGEP